MGEGDPTDDQPGQAETDDGGEDYGEWGNPELAVTTVEALQSVFTSNLCGGATSILVDSAVLHSDI